MKTFLVPLLTVLSCEAHAATLPSCDPEAVLLKVIRNEWSTVGDLLGPIRSRYDNGQQNRVRQTENCMDLGALVHRVPHAIGKTAAYEPYTHDKPLMALVGDLRYYTAALSMYCMDGSSDSEAREALDALGDRLPKLRALLK